MKWARKPVIHFNYLDPLRTFRVHSSSEVVYPNELKGMKEHAQVQEQQVSNPQGQRKEQVSNPQGQGKEQVSNPQKQGVVFPHEDKQEAPSAPKQTYNSSLFTPHPLFEDYQLHDDVSSDVKSFGMCMFSPDVSNDHVSP